MYIITNKNEQVITFSEKPFDFIDGNISDGQSIYLNGVETFEVNNLPEDSVPGKHCYNPEAGFYLDPGYEPSIEEKYEELQQKYNLMQAALDEMIFGL